MIIDILVPLLIMAVAMYGVCVSKSIIKSIICFNIIQAAIILLYIVFASSTGSEIPIISEFISDIVDPLPQALMITAIVISASVTALALMITVKVFHYYGTLNWNDLSKKDVKK